MLRSLSLLPSRFGERDHRNDTVRAGKFEMLDPEQPNKVRVCKAAISLPTLMSLSLAHCAAPPTSGLEDNLCTWRAVYARLHIIFYHPSL